MTTPGGTTAWPHTWPAAVYLGRLLAVSSKTLPNVSSPDCDFQLLDSHRWQVLNWTGLPSPSCIVIAMTLLEPHFSHFMMPPSSMGIVTDVFIDEFGRFIYG